MKTAIRIALALTLTIAFGACDKNSKHEEAVGGTCASMGGESCECPDGTIACSDGTGECMCDGTQEMEPTPAPDESADAISFPTNDLTCDETAASTVETWLVTHYAWTAHSVDLGDDLELVKLDGEATKADGEPFSLFVGPAGIRFQGRRLAADAELAGAHAESIDRSKREAKLLGIEWSHPGIAVSFAPDTPWKRVVWALDALESMDTGPLYLGFHNPRPESLGPPDPALVKELNDHFSFPNPKKSPRHAAATGDCEDMSKLYGALEKMPPEMRRKELPEQLGNTWVSCECKPDIEWLVGLQAFAPGYPVALIPFELGEETTVSHPADATWQDTHQSVVDAEGPITAKLAE